MSDPELIERSEAAGISTAYENWRHEQVEVPPATLRAILAALAAAPPPDAAAAPAGSAPPAGAAASGRASGGAAAGGSRVAAEAAEQAGAAGVASGLGADAAAVDGGGGALAPVPDRRLWGFAVQLYSVRSAGSWGHGDLRDLAELAAWSGRTLGAGFVLVNPLHAAEPVPPVSASPYLPMTRRYSSPLYLRVEDVPEYAGLTAEARQRVAELAEPLRARSATAELIDRDAVWTGQRAALELIALVPRPARRQAAFDAFRAREGAELDCWAAWCALAERHGPDWRRWPPVVRSRAGGLAAVAADDALRACAEFHGWLQWLVDDQLAAAQAAAREAGMALGIIHDLAVGVHPGGADAWAHQDLVVSGISVGAPPDSFNQRGQDWAQPPWHPQRLAAAGYQPLAELFAASFRHAGGLRVDHVMGLTRLWWVPAGMSADQGAYVRYDHTAAVAALTGQAVAAGGVAIGEDLGTVDPWVRSYLARHRVLGTMMLWFAQQDNGGPLPAAQWRRDAMATVGTHDVPTVAGFLTGDQVAERARLGLLTVPERDERDRAGRLIAAWLDALEAGGLLAPGQRGDLDAVTVALYAFLARTPAELISVSLADAVGEIRSQNIPGTSTEYPNWQIPLTDEAGQPVRLEDLPALPLLTAVARAASGAIGSDAG